MSYFTRGTFSKNCRTMPTWTDSAVTSTSYSYFTKSKRTSRETGKVPTTEGMRSNLKINLNNLKNLKSRYVYTRSA
jgi:hypothetical protein